MRRKNKTILWLSTCAFTFVTFIGGICSCTSEDELAGENSANSAEFQALVKELSQYSSEFSASHNTHASRFLGWDKFKESIKADHIGYSNGSWVGSIGESRKKWKELQEKEEIKKNNDNNNNNELKPEERAQIKQKIDSLKLEYQADCNNIGAIHNAAILQSFVDGDMDFDTTEQLVNSVIASIKSLGFETSGIVVKDVVKEIDDFFNEIYDEDVNVAYERLSQKYPERKDEFNIQRQYLSSIEKLTTVDDIYNFTKGYMQVIDNSNVSKELKNNLKANISVAPASNALWHAIEQMP